MKFSLLNFVFIYVLVWWTLLFCILPFGIEREDKKEFAGNSSAAPKNPGLKKKFIINTILSAIITLLIVFLAADN